MELENDIVADSEGEDEYFPVRPIGSLPPATKIQRPTLNDSIPVSGLPQGDTSHISEYTNKPLSHVESISVFTNKPQTSSHPDTEIPSDPPKPQRPRPRPLYKMKQPASSISEISGGDSSFAGSVLSIADRAKMRSRVPKPSESGPLPSKSPVAFVVSSGVVDISSDDDSDELNSLPKGKPKSRKGKKVSKPQKKVRHNAIDSPEHSPPQPISPASKNPFLPNDGDINSHYDHPTIATLIEPNTSPRGSSPLPSRQRQQVAEDDDVHDQLDSDIPPPTFFASSSLGPDKPVDDHSHQDDIPLPSPPMPPTKEKLAKKGRKKDSRKNENEEEPKGKSRSKGRKPKESKARAAAAKKSKGKGKEKEIFKSNEFVDEDSIRDEEPASILEEPNIMPDQMELSNSLPMTVEEPVFRSKTGRKRKEATNDEADGQIGETSKKKRKTEGVGQSKAKAKMVVLSDDEDISEHPSASVRPHSDEEVMEVEETDKPAASKTVPAATDGEAEEESTKENMQPSQFRVEAEKRATQNLDTPKTKNPSLISRHSVAPRFKSTPMSELIRRVNSLPSSPFPVGRSGRSIPGTAYSPYLKSNKSALSRIAPLHPNRRTPPPPLPPPPPPKKTKKEKEREEQWEEELIEEVGGMTEWVSMTDVERRDMRRMKREREMGGWED
ncbi:hypothetical protein IW261DRAFT_1560891 [Armillaria novae-zelandiae]|uniref:Uncharacterized protein n=1 Tax=Armillaria novae-zelandiae TaxID=153914 RepID=A0AA39PJ43_9AGAR|nr:hypothetical protein IW261DRAFT_1560891 [Armillaria novae-zelandiae]